MDESINKYIEELIELINYEREEETEVMISEIKYLSQQEREALGHTITDVKGKKLSKQFGLTTVQYGRSSPIHTEINISDRVIISQKDPLQSNLIATVIDKGHKYIKLEFDTKIPRWALKEKVRIDLYANDLTFKRMEDNLKELTHFGYDALEYHLGLKTPSITEDNTSLNFIDTSLNESQKKAVKSALSTKDFFLIHGPFGTGKTRTLTELIIQEHKRDKKILVTAESNIAVDNLLERIAINEEINITRLGQLKRIKEENQKYALISKVEQHPQGRKLQEYRNIINEYKNELNYYTKPTHDNRRGLSYNQIKQYARKKRQVHGINKEMMQSMARWIDYDEKIQELYNEIKKIEDKIMADIIDASDIIMSTNSSAALDVIKNIRFDTVVVDEASQTTIPSILIPIAKARRFILAGDHKQLPPTIISSQAYKLERTLFESLIRKYPDKAELLNVQYRMNDKLMKFSNQNFYNNQLTTGNQIKNITLNDILEGVDDDVITFIDTSQMENNQERQEEETNSYINPLEVELCTKIVNEYLDYGLKNEDIGIISPYSGQVNILVQSCDVEVKSVDGFQGREKELIIISTVRSNNRGEIGFLNDLRRLNVAITRARRKLIIIGNKQTLSSNKVYNQLIKYAMYN